MTAWVGVLRPAWEPGSSEGNPAPFKTAVNHLRVLSPVGSAIHSWRSAGLGVELAWISPPPDQQSRDHAIHPRWYIRGARRWLVWSESSHWPLLETSLSGEEPIAQTLQRWPGRYCGVCLDTALRQTHVFNDRLGLQRVFAYQEGSHLYVASRALPLVRSLPALQSWNWQAVAQTMVTGSALNGETLFNHLHLLPPGACWTHHPDARLLKNRYHRWPTDQRPEASDTRVWEEEFSHHLHQAVTRSIEGQMPMGMSLTGGWDGRLIMAYCDRPANTLPCYTFCGPRRECADARIAREVARICHQPFQTLHASPDWMGGFDLLARQVVRASDGAMDISAAVEIEMNRHAKALAPVRLTGNWGSEVLRSHIALRSRPDQVTLLDSAWDSRLQEAHHTYRALRQQPALHFILHAQMPWHHTARLSVEDSILEVRSPFVDVQLIDCMLRCPVPPEAMKALLGRLIARQSPTLAQLPTDTAAVAVAPSGWAAWSRRWQQLATTAQIKAEYWSDYGMPKSWAPIDRWLGDWSPAGWFLGRHKFAHFRCWYRHELAPWAADVLLSRQALSRGIYSAPTLRRMVREHRQGQSNHTRDLHRALTLELVAQEFFDSSASPC